MHQAYGWYCNYVRDEGCFYPVPYSVFLDYYLETMDMTKKERKRYMIERTEDYHRKRS